MAGDQQTEAVTASLLVFDGSVGSVEDSRFDLGVSELLSQPNDEIVGTPPSKKHRLSLASTLRKRSSSARSVNRFSKPVISPERLWAARSVVPVNTEASTQWAMKNFHAWAQNRSTQGTVRSSKQVQNNSKLLQL